MANRPTQLQQALFEDMLEESVSSAITRVQLDRLPPAQRNKILETRKLQNLLLEAQSAEDLRAGFASIKWSLIKYEKNIVYASGSTDAWEQYPHSWLQENPVESPCALRAAFGSSTNHCESTWLAHHILASDPVVMLPDRNCFNPTNNFIAHLIAQGLNGNSLLTSTAFGGFEQQLRLHDVVLTYHQNTKNYNWDPVLASTTWSTSLEVENTLFAVFSNYKHGYISADDCEKLAKRLPLLPINWEREFETIQQPLYLAAAVCSSCVTGGIPRTKRLKKLYTEAVCALTCMEPSQQNKAVEQILLLSEGFRNQGGMPAFLDVYKDIMPLLSPLARRTSTTALIGEFICHHKKQLVDHTYKLLRSLPKKEQIGFTVEHLQIMHKHISRFVATSYYTRGEIVGKDLFNTWKALRPYMDETAGEVVDGLSTQLRTLIDDSEIKEWTAALNLQVNIKAPLSEKADKKPSRKM